MSDPQRLEVINPQPYPAGTHIDCPHVDVDHTHMDGLRFPDKPSGASRLTAKPTPTENRRVVS